MKTIYRYIFYSQNFFKLIIGFHVNGDWLLAVVGRVIAYSYSINYSLVFENLQISCSTIIV